MGSIRTKAAESVSEEDLLSARRYLYGLLWLVFAEEPKEELVEALVSNLSHEAVLIVGANDDEFSASFERVEKEWDSLVCEGLPEPMDAVRSQYTKAFLGPGKLAAYPWESMYVESAPGLFQDSTLAVRRSYAEQGMRAARLNAEPDDHIATELHFMVKMSERSIGAGPGLPELASAQISFLDDHLLRWITEYAVNLRESRAAPFYSTVLEFAETFMRADRTLLSGFVMPCSSGC